MTWRTVVLTKNAKLSLRLNHLVISTDEVVTIPLNEIGQIVIENPNITMTGHILNALSKYKITTIICDEKHIPSTHVNLIHGHFRRPQIIQKQIQWTDVRKKQLWKRIVMEKINNQYYSLNHCGFNDLSSPLLGYASEVEIDDHTNREGHAAKVYFKLMYGKDFIRGADTPINWALNYGYSILLSLFTRVLTTKGLLTELGIHHSNQYNHYNLASDFMEVYRPLIDTIVKEHITDSFGKDEKRLFIHMLNDKVLIKNRMQYIPNSIEIYVDGLISYLNEGNAKKLVFPKLFDG